MITDNTFFRLLIAFTRTGLAMNRLRTAVPDSIRKKLGSPKSLLLNGADVFSLLRDDESIVMGCNPRIHHVIPGIMRAAEELDAVVAFELTKTEGGLDGGIPGRPRNSLPARSSTMPSGSALPAPLSSTPTPYRPRRHAP